MMTTSLAIPPAGIGDCALTSHRDPATGEYALTIDHADPRILISASLLREAFEAHDPACAECHVHVRLADVIPYEDIYLGATIRMEGTNRTVLYRITGRHDEYAYIGEWPD